MPITRSYTITDFDAVTSALTLTVTASDAAIPFSYTVDTMYWLPVDNYGNVPTGSELNDILTAHSVNCITDTMFANLANIQRAGGSVVNVADIFAIISGGGLGGIPVVIYPDRAYGLNPGPTTFIRSVIVAVGSVATPPFVYNDYTTGLTENQWTIDNGNVYGSGTQRSKINSIVQVGSAASPQNVEIVGSINGSWPIGQAFLDMPILTPPQYIIDQYPYVFREGVDMSGFGTTGVGKYYYVEHTPLTITTNVAGGFFTYQ